LPAEHHRPDIQVARQEWVQSTREVEHHRLLFFDESGAKTNMTRLYGRAPRGTRVHDYVPNGRWETTTMMAVIGHTGPQAPWVLDGPMNGAAFLTYVEKVLVPILRPTDILVMDNLTSHKNPAARALIVKTGAQIWDLPAYSPDLNPIEKMWSKVKAFLRKTKARDAHALCQAIGHALDQVSLDDIKGWFGSCGYSLN